MTAEHSVPPPLPWEERLKTVYLLPGGYEGYLDTLHRILGRVRERRPEREELSEWLRSEFGITLGSARFRLAYLERIGLLAAEANKVELTEVGARWLEHRDDASLVGFLHRRIQLMGEFLELLGEPRTSDELLQLANQRYRMGWKTRAQIDRRRGWLQSAGMVTIDEEGRLVRTPSGGELLHRLEVHEPEGPEPDPSGGGTEGETVPTPPEVQSPRTHQARELARALSEAGHRAGEPDLFEQLVARAFTFLGFESLWLGGSGKTDVLLVAELGPADGFRVIIDCKTTGKGGITDAHVDWITLQDHRGQHRGDHVALVGPSFTGRRIRERAEKHEVTLLDVETLSGLLRQHALVPLGLAVYRKLFEPTDGADGSTAIAEIAEEADRRTRLAAQVVRVIGRTEGREGPLDARDLYWLLRNSDEELSGYTEEEIGEILTALAAPGLELLAPAGGGYLTLGSRQTMRARLQHLAELIADEEAAEGAVLPPE